MTGFLRPEARIFIARWREALIGCAVALLGFWFVVGPGRLLVLPGFAGLVFGVILIVIGVQRGRFRGPGGGPGTVQVIEGQVAYFGPLTGGAVALRELERLTLDATMKPAHWRLDQRDQPPLLIPVNADGAEALFDAFATLPGLKTERMLTQLRQNRRSEVLVWQRHLTSPQLEDMSPMGRA